MKLTSIIFGAAGIILAGQVTAANLISNGSFETGAFAPGWTVTNSGSTPYASVVPFGPNFYGENVPSNPGGFSPDASGAYGVYFVSDFATPETLSQTVTAPTTGTYTLGFSAYVPQNGYNNVGTATFSGSVAGVTLVSTEVHSLAPTKWYNFFGTTHLTAGQSVMASFDFNTNLDPSADIVVDQVFLVPGGVPEPATWAMMLTGFGIAGAAMRRRRATVAA